MGYKHKLYGTNLSEEEHRQPFTRYGATLFYNKLVSLILEVTVVIILVMIVCTALIFFRPEIQKHYQEFDLSLLSEQLKTG